jgi:pyruvate, orthophosphate dikinase
MSIVRIKTGASPSGTPETIGAKAAILAKVASFGLPVPPAFVLPIDLGAAMMQGDKDAERAFADGLEEGIAFLEEETGQSFGHRRHPLLVSVRSGAARSMPGMLDTVLDVGCTSEATRGLIRMTGNPRFAFDCRRRFLEAYAETVLGLDFAPFRAKRDVLIAEASAASEFDLDSEALERLSYLYEDLIAASGEDLPDGAMEQLTSAARAVYRSFQSERCSIYRRLQGYEDLKGSAVMVQAMVFGNRGTNSASGVAFSRDPSTGAPSPVIDVLFEAQGEDVVSGRGRPLTEKELAGAAPRLAAELHVHLKELERDFRDVQDIEFTIEDGRLWILQARAAKRTARAALKIAVDFVHEGLCSPEEALQRLSALDLRNLAVARFASRQAPAARGIGAAGGVAVGRAAFDAASAKRLAASGESVVLVRPDIDTSDVAGLAAASGALTAMGGRTAHASLIARQMGKACVVSCSGLVIDEAAHRCEIGGVPLLEGDWLSVDGDTGEVFLGQIEIVTERPEAMLAEVESWREDAAKHRGRTALGVAE